MSTTYSIFTEARYNPPKFKKLVAFSESLVRDGTSRMVIGSDWNPNVHIIKPWKDAGALSRVTVVLPSYEKVSALASQCILGGAEMLVSDGIEIPTKESMHPVRKLFLQRDYCIIQNSDIVCVWPTPTTFGNAPTNYWGKLSHVPGWSRNLGKEVRRLDLRRKQPPSE